MTIILPSLAVAFAAFCVWLTVRIVNRRERWAKWTLAAAVGLPVLYVLGFGPSIYFLCLMQFRRTTPHPRFDRVRDGVSFVYRPILVSIANAPKPIGKRIRRFYSSFLPEGGLLEFYFDSSSGSYCVSFFNLG